MASSKPVAGGTLYSSVSGSQKARVDQAVSNAMEAFKRHAPEEYQQAVRDKSVMENIKRSAQKAAAEQIAMASDLKRRSPDETKNILSRYLPPERVNMIITAFSWPTFKIDIQSQRSTAPIAYFTKEGQPIWEPLMLDTKVNLDTAYWRQMASLFIEVVLYAMMAIVGYNIISLQRVRQLAEALITEIRRVSAVAIPLTKLAREWGTSSILQRARLMWNVISSSYQHGLLWNTIRLMCGELSWWERAEIMFSTSASIAAALISEGESIIAMLGLALDAASNLVDKIRNLSQTDSNKV